MDAAARAFFSVDRMLSGDKEKRIEVKVINLSHNSPSCITFEANELIPTSSGESFFDTFIRIAEELKAAGASIVSLQYPRYVLEAFRDLASGAKKLKEVRYTIGTKSVVVEGNLCEYIELLLNEERQSLGSIRGMLEYMNVHKGSNTLRIYPPVGPSFVNCTFKESLKEKVREGMSRYVEVKGKLHYKAGADFPYEIELEDIEIMPAESDLPSIFEIKGIVNDFQEENHEW